jgi:hypothetical protein
MRLGGLQPTRKRSRKCRRVILVVKADTYGDATTEQGMAKLLNFEFAGDRATSACQPPGRPNPLRCTALPRRTSRPIPQHTINIGWLAGPRL